MAAKKPVTVGSLYFEKQGDALAFFKAILWKYEVGDRISDEDAVHVRDLFHLHRDFEEKSGDGEGHYEIMISDEGSRCLGIVQINDRKVGFSYRRCITQLWD